MYLRQTRSQNHNSALNTANVFLDLFCGVCSSRYTRHCAFPNLAKPVQLIIVAYEDLGYRHVCSIGVVVFFIDDNSENADGEKLILELPFPEVPRDVLTGDKV